MYIILYYIYEREFIITKRILLIIYYYHWINHCYYIVLLLDYYKDKMKKEKTNVKYLLRSEAKPQQIMSHLFVAVLPLIAANTPFYLLRFCFDRSK